MIRIGTIEVRRAGLAAVAALCILAIGCSDDDENGMGPEADPIIGTWVSTSLVADGQDLSAVGIVLTLTFEENGDYSLTVAGDATGVFCETGTTCSESGTFTYTSSRFTFDPGTVDETDLDYSISGDTLTVTGDIEGTNVTFVFDRQ